MKKNRQLVVQEDNLLLHRSGVSLYEESNNLYYFECNNPRLSYFITNDFMEATSALMKLKEFHNDEMIWDITISDEMRKNVSLLKSLYWLTGGDIEWVNNKIYNDTWNNLSEKFLSEFKEDLEDIVENSETLADVRDGFLTKLNLPTLYEFALSKGMVR